jgi:hypothetical protein
VSRFSLRGGIGLLARKEGAGAISLENPWHNLRHMVVGFSFPSNEIYLS